MTKLKVFNRLKEKVKSIFTKIKYTFVYKRMPHKQKNFLYKHHDEVKPHKLYAPSVKFYSLLVLIPSVVTGTLMVILHILTLLTDAITTTVAGLIGGYIASVLVSWVLELKDCNSKTQARLRFQHVYFEDIYKLCKSYIYFNVSYLGNNFKKEVSAELVNGKEYKIFKGFSWQYWCSLLNDLLYLNKEDPSNYEKSISVKAGEKIVSEYFESNSFTNKILDIVNSYKNSIDSVFVNDYIFNFQRLLIIDLLSSLEELVECLDKQNYDDFWNKNHQVLSIIKLLPENLYLFKDLREDEHVYLFNKVGNDEVYVHHQELTECFPSEGHTLIKREEYRKFKKLNKVISRFEEDNSTCIDNGWFDS